jgi:hypothetical protein
VSPNRRAADREQCGNHEARLANLESWISRIDARFWWIVAGIAASSIGTVINILITVSLRRAP